MNIRRMTPPDFVELMNHPSIHPTTGFPMGFTIPCGHALNSRIGNIGYMSDIGGMVFFYEYGHIYDGHFLFHPKSGGKLIKDTARKMLNLMFTEHGACVIRGYPPRDNRAVRMIGVGLGFVKIPNEEFTDDLGRLCDTYELRELR